MFISERFEKQVILHLIKNMMPQTKNSPLILGIHGPSGEGKSFQCYEILKRNQVKAFFISAGQLESANAGDPAKLIRSKYLEAGTAIEKGLCRFSVLVINDIDAGIGNWGSLVQTTVNNQLICAQLMDLVDRPNEVDTIETKRIPIIVTGNDFGKLYEPMVRAGRMVGFEWIPTKEEKIRMIYNLFTELTITEIDELYSYLTEDVEESKFYQKMVPISFFSHLQSMLYDTALWKLVKEEGALKVIEHLSQGKLIALEKKSRIEEIRNLAIELLKSGELVNHLKFQSNGEKKGIDKIADALSELVNHLKFQSNGNN